MNIEKGRGNNPMTHAEQAAESSNESSVPQEALTEKFRKALNRGHDEYITGLHAEDGMLAPVDVVPPGTPIPEYRGRTLDNLLGLLHRGLGKLPVPEEHGGDDRFDKFLLAMEQLAFYGGSQNLLATVQVTLSGGSFFALADKTQIEEYGDKLIWGLILGAFAITEYESGSDTQNSGNIFKYNPDTQKFIINTTDPSRNKSYIGNSLNGTHATVFGRLDYPGCAGHGKLHAFWVQIRDEHGKPMPGVTINDHGYKDGYHGVDNGNFGFKNVEIDRTAMLSGMVRILEDGTYECDVDPNKLFGTMLTALTPGREAIALLVNAIQKRSMAIAVNTAKEMNVSSGPFLEQQLTHDRLHREVAQTVASHVYNRMLVDKIQAKQVGHKEVTIAKIRSTESAADTIDTMRTLIASKSFLGGLFAEMASDVSVSRNFEGDNQSLRMSLARKAVREEQKKADKADEDGKSISYTELNPNADILFTDTDYRSTLFERRKNNVMADLLKSPKDTILQTEYVDAMIDCEILAAFDQFVEEQTDPEIKSVFADLRDLHVIDLMLTGDNWHLNRTQTKALKAQRDKLYVTLEPHIPAVVAGFGVPDHLSEKCKREHPLFDKPTPDGPPMA